MKQVSLSNACRIVMIIFLSIFSTLQSLCQKSVDFNPYVIGKVKIGSKIEQYKEDVFPLYTYPNRQNVTVTKGDFKYYFIKDSTFKIFPGCIISKFLFAVDSQNVVNYIFIELSGDVQTAEKLMDSIYIKGAYSATSSLISAESIDFYWGDNSKTVTLLRETYLSAVIPKLIIHFSFVNTSANMNVPHVSFIN